MKKEMMLQEDNNLIDSCLNNNLTNKQKDSLQRAVKISASKDDVFKAITKESKPQKSLTIGRIVRTTMRYAAMLAPLLIIGIVWAGEIKSFFIKQYEIAVRSTTGDVAPIDSKETAIVINFESASLQTVVDELINKYPQIKGVKGHVTDDTVKITTTFVNQSLDEVFEELNIHFDKKIALSNDGYLTISD